MMSDDQLRGHLSPGALALLKIVLENDPELVIVRNMALLKSIEVTEGVFSNSPRKSLATIRKELEVTDKTHTFLELAAAVLSYIRVSITKAFQGGQSIEGFTFATDYDRQALHALVLTYADIAWPDRSGDDYDGPSAQTTVNRLQDADKRHFFDLLMRNYIGDIFQDYFSRTGVRRLQPTLPKDREINLRVIDAQALVDHVSRVATQRNQPSAKQTDLLKVYYDVLRSAWE